VAESSIRADGAKIRAARDAKGWSQEALAKAAGYQLSVIQKLEQGTYFSLRCLECCAEALEVLTADLLVTSISQENEFPHIPDVPDNLVIPVRCLVSFAVILRGVFIQLGSGKPLQEIVQERGQYLEQGDKVIDAWVKKLDVFADDDVQSNHASVVRPPHRSTLKPSARERSRRVGERNDLTTVDLGEVDWSAVGDNVYSVLLMIAKNPKIALPDIPEATLEQISAMAITQMLNEDLHGLAEGQPIQRRSLPPEITG
jgi:transcriptional regulator with XRE-family HTH domain